MAAKTDKRNGSLEPAASPLTSFASLHSTDKSTKRPKKSVTTVNGLIITDHVVFRNWQPGDKLVENILLKNVGNFPVTVTYTATKTPTFITSFPKKLELFTGNVFRIPVTFEPTRKQHYEDTMQFFVDGDIVTVKLSADMPKLRVKMSTKLLNFGERPCGVPMTKEVHVSNCGEREFKYQWTVDYPFSVEPGEGAVQPGETVTITVTFNSMELVDYSRIATILCKDEEFSSPLVLNLRARSRSATYLLYRPQPEKSGHINLEFGQFSLGQMDTKKISVVSSLDINVPFTLTRQFFGPENSNPITAEDECFSRAITSGILRPNAWLDLPITFSAKYLTPGVTEYFLFKSGLQDSEIVVRCYAGVQGPSVTASTNTFDFGSVFLHESSKIHLSLKNSGQTEAMFQFDQPTNDSCIFNVAPSEGSISANSEILITVTFRPTWPIIYRQQLKCLIHLDGVLTFDVFGTCHSSLIQPPVLQLGNVISFREPTLNDVVKAGPRTVKEKVESGVLKLDKHGFIETPQKGFTSVTTEPFTFSTCALQFRDWFESPQVFRDGPFIIDNREISYGFSAVGSPLTRTIKMTSTSSENLLIHWTKDPQGVFTVAPETATLIASSTMDFAVTFCPNVSNPFFHCDLNCHIMYDYLTGFQLIKQYQVIPPWTMTLRLIGHAATLCDRSYLHPRLIYHNETRPDGPITYRNFTQESQSSCTFFLKNPTNNTVLFKMEKDPDRAVEIKPLAGILLPRQTKLIATQLLHYEPKTNFLKELNVILNDYEKTTQKILFRAYYDPALHVAVENHIIFPETALGKVSELPFSINNWSKFPIKFLWFIPETIQTFLQVSKRIGEIASHDSKTVDFAFRPNNLQPYDVVINLRVTSPHGRFENHRVPVAGRGVIGHISLPAEKYHFKHECLRTPVTYTFEIRNDNRFEVECQLLADYTPPNGDCQLVDLFVKKENDPLSPLTVTQSLFKLPALTQEKVNFTFVPLQTGSSAFRLFSRPMIPSSPDDVESDIKAICQITLEVKQPILEIADLCGYGSLSAYGKQRLWDLLRIQKLNSAFREPADIDETNILKTILTYRAGTIPEINCKTEVPVFLGTAVQGETSTVRLALKNIGGPACRWRIIFLEDLEIKVKEIRPQTSLLDHYMHLRKNEIIEIVPSRGVLRESETAVMDIKCSHGFVGTHVLPVLFEIDKGRLIFIRFSATTIAEIDVALTVCKNYLTFAPAPVSSKFAVTQTIEAYNPANHDVFFKVHLTDENIPPRSDAENVFQCLLPEGRIPARSFGVIPFTYRPLHLCANTANFCIAVQNNLVYHVHVTGSGCSMGEFCDRTKEPGQVLEPEEDWRLDESKILHSSTTHLDFGCVPFFSINRRIIFVQNQHTAVLRFNWLAAPKTQTATDFVTIEPEAGILQPGGCALFTITYDAQNHCGQFNHTYTLQFVDGVKMDEYTKGLQGWIKEVRERCLNFTITKQNPNADSDVAKALEYIDDLEKSLNDPKLRSVATLHFNQVTPKFLTLMCMLKARRDVRVPPLMVEPKMHEIHLSVACQATETALYRLAYPEQLKNFFYRVPAKNLEIYRNDPVNLDYAEHPEIAAIANTLLEKALEKILLENFREDADGIMKCAPLLYYADIVRAAQDDKSTLNSERIEPMSSGDFVRGAEEGPVLSEIKTIREKGPAVEAFGVSPRISIKKRVELVKEQSDVDGTDLRDIVLPKTPSFEDCKGEVFRDPIFQTVAHDIFHDFLVNILADCRNYVFDLFDQPRLLLNSDQPHSVDNVP